jgi:hypothetical protein
MLTFFTTAKPFEGHSGIIQRNALRSWKLLAPDIEVILFGDEDGAAEVCAEYGLRHELHVERFESKLPYVNGMFARAQQTARHDFLCYSNCDIILTDDFLNAFEKACAWRRHFLMVAQRWDTDVKKPIDFSDPDWASKLRQRTLTAGKLQIPDFVDFFVFPRGLYDSVPPLIVGYAYWDHWMIWKALSAKCPVLDGSRFIVPVHQSHPYTTTPERSKGSRTDALATRNFELSGNGKHLRSIPDATHAMTRRGAILRTPFRRQATTLFELCSKQGFLNHTYRLRKRLGLRRATIQHMRGRMGAWFEWKP